MNLELVPDEQNQLDEEEEPQRISGTYSETMPLKFNIINSARGQIEGSPATTNVIQSNDFAQTEATLSTSRETVANLNSSSNMIERLSTTCKELDGDQKGY